MLEFKTGFYDRMFHALDNNAVLMRVEDDGTYYPIWCSHEFTEMMEGTEQDFIRLENASGMNTIHPDDREQVAYLFKHRHAQDGSNSLTIRKFTVTGHEIWVNVHYAFVEEDGVQYAYCSYFDITEIKRREHLTETLRRQQESLRIVHGMLRSGPWYMDFDEQGTMTSVTWTEEFRKMLGYESEEDFPNRLESWSDLLHEDDKERVLAAYNDAIRDYTGQTAYDVTYRLLTRDRGWRWFHAVGQLSRRPDGSPITYVGMFVDIDEQKEMEERLAQQENERAAHSSMVSQLNTISDESLTVVRSNLTKGIVEEVRGRDLYPTDRAGCSVEAYAQSRLEGLLVEEDRQRYSETFSADNLLARAAAGEGPATMFCYCKRASGRRCFVKYTGIASHNPLTGDVEGFGIETDYTSEMVTEVMNEKILVKQYDMVSYIVSGYYGVVIGDAANIKKGGIFPKCRDGVYGDYITGEVLPVVPEAERMAMAEALSLDTVARRLQGDDSYSVDVTCLIDGETFNKHFTFYAVDAEHDLYILLKTDVTDVLRERQERNELLASALKEAERANAAKTSFLSSMSHEIRTPMNAIIGLDSIALAEPDLAPRTREHLEKIGTSAKHLLSLINDILDMSRIESGRMSLKSEEFSFREMLEQVNTMINGQCQDKGLTYSCRINGSVADYYIGDAMKLKQVIINILGNAVKFTPEGGEVSFLVEPVSSFEDKATMRFVMSDTGIGMNESYLPKLFDAFSQEDASNANKYGSTGLGMAITKNIVEMMNGSIAVESEKGVGSTFTVVVTLKRSDRTAQGVGDLRPQDLRVLVVDDDPVACEHATLVLEEAGIASDSCLSGAEALEMLRLAHARRQAYDLILVDLRMPGKDGVEVTRQIRELYQGESAIIILTAYSWDDIMEEALAAGVDSFISKPLFVSNVLSEFKQVIQRKGAEGESKAELAGRRILLAEDILINAEIMRELLGMREMEVDHAENGQEAVDMFAASPEGHYDAVLMDVRMPVMTGLEATAAIRALGRPDAKTIPIVAMTANAFDEDVQRSLQVGMNAHLSKPVEPERLFETLETLIQG